MLVLGIESSCDETSVALVEDGKIVHSNVIYTQIDIHTLYGGVVPEVASRMHVKKITYVIDQAFKEANKKYEDIDLIAVTDHPGLIGSLMVGINAAKTIAYVYNKPIVYVDHIHGHIYANYLEQDFEFPLLALVVSGGHTELVLMKDHFEFETIGETLDDAVGEAYDKIARVVNVGYPGGPIIDKMAKNGNPTYPLPHAMVNKDGYDFSFSGIKSAVINLNHKYEQNKQEINKDDLACSFQTAVIDILTSKTLKAVKEFGIKQVVVAGGVAANKGLREKMAELAVKEGFKLTVPSFKYCTDNAAMIAVAGYFQKLHELKKGSIK